MAKKNGNWKIIVTIIALVGLLVSGITGYTKAMVRIAVTETEVANIKEDITEIKGDVKEILRTVKGE
jgi:hypothetical protein